LELTDRIGNRTFLIELRRWRNVRPDLCRLSLCEELPEEMLIVGIHRLTDVSLQEMRTGEGSKELAARADVTNHTIAWWFGGSVQKSRERRDIGVEGIREGLKCS
jgi:hypothetical protein